MNVHYFHVCVFSHNFVVNTYFVCVFTCNFHVNVAVGKCPLLEAGQTQVS
jgi:hypothetical protein